MRAPQLLGRCVGVGSVVFIVRDQAQDLIPRYRAEDALRVIEALRPGDTNAGREFPEDVRGQLRAPVRLVRL